MVGRPERALGKPGRAGRVFAHHTAGPPGELRVPFITPVQDETLPFQRENLEILVAVLNERRRTCRPIGDHDPCVPARAVMPVMD